jgi:3-hydroxyisobutyrate dehydrogenase-like beta-hydroxyacid dehydrogenase
MTKLRLGFLGLGSMGGGMARSLLRAGFAVTVYDPITQLVQSLEKEGATSAGSPREVGERTDVVLSSQPMPADVEAAVTGPDGLVAGMAAGKTYIDLSTIDPVTSRRMHEALAAKGVRMLDCPVGKGPAEAARGELTLMVGGDAAVLDEMREVLGALGTPILHCGPAGAGAAAKVVNNLVSCSLVALNAEALVLAAKSGVDLDMMCEIMKSTAADNRHLRITTEPLSLEGNFAPRFKLALARKDLGLAVQLGIQMGVPTPVATAARVMHDVAQGMGLGDEDQGAVLKAVEQAAGAEARRKRR